MTDALDDKRDFFVSFNQADRAWATWIAWALEDAGYSVWFQDWDFRGNFVLEMDKAHAQSRRTLAVLSPDYLASRFTAPEWAARFAQDATSQHDLLIPVRVRPCEFEGLLAQIVYVDLVGCGEAAARDKLLRRVEGIRLKPDEAPLFPSEASHEAVPERPAFPAPARAGAGGAATEHLASVAGRSTPPAPWLVGAMALGALVVVAAVWLLTSGGGNGTGIQGGVEVGGGNPIGTTINNGYRPAHRIGVGDNVIARWSDDCLYSATVLEAQGDKYLVHYEFAEEDWVHDGEVLEPTSLMSSELAPGTRVYARPSDQQTKWLRSFILRYENGKYLIALDNNKCLDGATHVWVNLDQLTAAP